MMASFHHTSQAAKNQSVVGRFLVIEDDIRGFSVFDNADKLPGYESCVTSPLLFHLFHLDVYLYPFIVMVCRLN